MRKTLYTALSSKNVQDLDVYFVLYALDAEKVKQFDAGMGGKPPDAASIGTELASTFVNLTQLAQNAEDGANEDTPLASKLKLADSTGKSVDCFLNVAVAGNSLLRMLRTSLNRYSSAAAALAAEAVALPLKAWGARFDVKGVAASLSLPSSAAGLRVGIRFLQSASFYGGVVEPTVAALKECRLSTIFDAAVGSDLRRSLFMALGSLRPQDSECSFSLYALDSAQVTQVKANAVKDSEVLGTQLGITHINLAELAKTMDDNEGEDEARKMTLQLTNADAAAIGSIHVSLRATALLRSVKQALKKVNGVATNALKADAKASQVLEIRADEEAKRKQQAQGRQRAKTPTKEAGNRRADSPASAGSTPAKLSKRVSSRNVAERRVTARLRVKRDGSSRVSLVLKVVVD
eukprot:7205573-Prymnesium_polylepis.1